MAAWLLKTEPSAYSYDDLVREKQTRWDGIANAAAKKNLRGIRRGDTLLIYHTGDERQVVGLAEATADAGEDDGGVFVLIRATRRLTRPLTLAAIRATPTLVDWQLVKQGRLSVVPTSAAQLETVLRLGDDRVTPSGARR